MWFVIGKEMWDDCLCLRAIEDLEHLPAQLLLVLGPRGVVAASPFDHACKCVFVEVHGISTRRVV